MIFFKPVQPLFLNTDTGRVFGDPSQIAALGPQVKNYGIPEDELKTQVEALQKMGVTLTRAQGLIEKHPEITDKEGAKAYAETLYQEAGPLPKATETAQ